MNQVLTQARVKELFDYDPVTGDLIWKVKRRGRFARPGAVAGCAGRYITVSVDCHYYPAHHVVWLIHYGYVPDEIDHIDRDKHNNRIENLRECTRSENTGNVGLRSTNTTGYKGVSFAKYCNKWRTGIKINGKAIHLGYFNCPEDAAAAYDKAAKIFFGEFAYLNHENR